MSCFFPFSGGDTETSKLTADSCSWEQWESFHQSVTLNSYRTDRIDVKQTINIICDKEKKDCFQTSSCMIYRSIQCDVLWRASTRFFHSSIKELLPPGRGPAVVAQQCPVGESLFLPPAKRLAFRMDFSGRVALGKRVVHSCRWRRFEL